MPTRVYSRPFISKQGASAPETVVVPAGHVWVVKMITSYANPAFGSITVAFRNFTTGCLHWRHETALLTHHDEQVPLTIAFLQGEEFGFSIGTFVGDSADVFAGGYDLLMPSS